MSKKLILRRNLALPLFVLYGLETFLDRINPKMRKPVIGALLTAGLFIFQIVISATLISTL